MSGISRLVDPNPPLNAAQVQAALAAALAANPPSTIKSIQRGVINVSGSNVLAGTVTITSVNQAKAELRFLGSSGFVYVSSAVGFSQGGYRYAYNPGVRMRLTSQTTIEWYRSIATFSGTLSYELIEKV